jgi:cytochrome d ubiquinol oxidase subunit II
VPVGGGPVLVTGWFPLLVGIASAVLMAAHASAYLSWRMRAASGDPGTGRWFLVPLAAVVVAAVATLGFANPDVRHAVGHPTAALVVAGALVALLLVATVLARVGRARPAFFVTGVSLALPVVLVGLALFPNILVSTGAAAGVTVTSGAANDATLRVLTWVCAPAIPLLVALQAVSWSLFTTKRSGTRYW